MPTPGWCISSGHDCEISLRTLKADRIDLYQHRIGDERRDNTGNEPNWARPARLREPPHVPAALLDRDGPVR
jgi:hypothetical protein